MASGVTGNPASLGQLTAKLQRMLGVPQKTAIRFAPVLAQFLKQEFATGTDPQGNAWKPLKASTLKKGRTPPPLTDTGKARDALTVVPRGVKDKASLVGYLRYHLSTGRAVVPLLGEMWPSAWIDAIKREADKVIRDIAEGR